MSHQQHATPSGESGNSQVKATNPATTAGRKSAYFWGAASGVALAVFAPMFRPAARSVVKSGIRVGRYAQKVASSIKEEFEDIASEAKADLNHEDKNES